MLGQCQRGLGRAFHHRHWLFLGGPPLAQRCLSDPGADSPSNLHRKGFKEHLLSKDAYNQAHKKCSTFLTKQRTFEINYHCLFIFLHFLCSETSHHPFCPSGEGEFNQRLERFKVPDSQASPAPALSQVNHSPRPCSNFVSDIQQKLQCSTTPSSQQASRLREVGSGGLYNQTCLCASNHFRLAFEI